MMPPRSLILPVAMLAAGAGLGYLAGRSPQQSPAVVATAQPSGAQPVIPTSRTSPVAPASGSKEVAADAKSGKNGASSINEAELQSDLRALGVSQQLLFANIASFRAMADLQDRLRASDVEGMAASMSNSATSPRRDVYKLVMSAYAEKDPDAAWALASGIKIAATRNAAQNAVLVTIADRDPVRALGLIDSLPDSASKRQLKSAVLVNLAQKDPQRAWSLYQKDSSGSEGRYSFTGSSIFTSWAAQDPEAAKAAASRLQGSTGDSARNAVVSALAQTDPQAAWAYARTLPVRGEGFGNPLVQAVSSWAQNDPEAALAAAMSIQEVGVRGAAISGAMGAWSANDLDGALKYAIAEQDSTLRSDMFRSMRSTGNEDRRKLLTAMMEHMPAGDNYQRTVTNLLHEWARSDPREAAFALNQLPPGKMYNDMAHRVASEWSEQVPDKREMLSWIQQMPAGEARRNAYRSAFTEWSSRNPQEALAAMQALSPEDRNSVTQAVASGWGERDPEAVIRWSSGIQDAKARGDVVRRAIGQWARHSPEEASRYLQTLPPEMQASSVHSLVEHWASKDVEAAAQWLQGQPATPARDSGIEAIVRRIAQEDPVSAIAWASSIADTGKRNGQLEHVARDWIRQDSANAKAWISKSNLPPEMRDKLLK